jgi:ribosomal protein L18
LVDDLSGRTLASASSVGKKEKRPKPAEAGAVKAATKAEARKQRKQTAVKDAYGGNVKSAKAVGLKLAEAAKAAGITRAAFDRGHYRFHGRVKALADGAREGGLQF